MFSDIMTRTIMHNQFKRSSTRSVRELYYIYRKTRILGLMSHVTIIKRMAGLYLLNKKVKQCSFLLKNYTNKTITQTKQTFF